MANASSLYLPGSNLTNLLVLSDGRRSGGSRSCSKCSRRRSPRPPSPPPASACSTGALSARGAPAPSQAPMPVRAGAPGCSEPCSRRVLMLALANPALPVLALALALLAWRALRSGAAVLRDGLRALGLPVLGSLFLLSVGLGIAARSGLVPLGWLHERRRARHGGRRGARDRRDQQPPGRRADVLERRPACPGAADRAQRRARISLSRARWPCCSGGAPRAPRARVPPRSPTRGRACCCAPAALLARAGRSGLI